MHGAVPAAAQDLRQAARSLRSVLLRIAASVAAVWRDSRQITSKPAFCKPYFRYFVRVPASSPICLISTLTRAGWPR